MQSTKTINKSKKGTSEKYFPSKCCRCSNPILSSKWILADNNGQVCPDCLNHSERLEFKKCIAGKKSKIHKPFVNYHFPSDEELKNIVITDKEKRTMEWIRRT